MQNYNFVQYRSSFFHVPIENFYTWLKVFTQSTVVMVVANIRYGWHICLTEICTEAKFWGKGFLKKLQYFERGVMGGFSGEKFLFRHHFLVNTMTRQLLRFFMYRKYNLLRWSSGLPNQPVFYSADKCWLLWLHFRYSALKVVFREIKELWFCNSDFQTDRK